MAMREECKNFQSRTYSSGEAARFCALNLAPEAPFRCPSNCPKYERRLADVGWKHGSLVPKPVESVDSLDDHSRDIEDLLDQAEMVVNLAVDEALEDIKEEKRKRLPFWKRRDQ